MACCPYRDYYQAQAGGKTSVFYGARHQSGHGLGSLFSSLGRIALPLLRQGAMYLGKRVLSTGADIVRDVVDDGKGWRESAKMRMNNTGRVILDDFRQKMQAGGSSHRVYKRKRLAPTKSTRPKTVKRKKRLCDIYD